MTERPILYSAPMVLAKLAGRKTQTRRILKVQPLDVLPLEGDLAGKAWVALLHRGADIKKNSGTVFRSRFGVPGDRLWGRETFAPCEAPALLNRFQYAADGAVGLMTYDSETDRWFFARHGHTVGITLGDPHGVWVGKPSKWKPSIFMPRRASRLLDEVVSVRVERLQDISNADAIAEGIEAVDLPAAAGGRVYQWPTGTSAFTTARDAYLDGWDTINGKGAAAKNPWVWRVETRPVK